MTRPSDKEREEAERMAPSGAVSSGSASYAKPEGERAAAGLPPGAEPSAEERLRAEAQEARRERDQFRNMAMLAQADLANYRKRVDEEREQLLRAASAQVLLRLFPVLDDLDRALAQAPQAENLPWVEGMQLIGKKFRAFLDDAGVQRIDPLGKLLDPWEHEVVAYLEPAPGLPEGQVVGVVAVGYRLHGRVLRPAQVVVTKAAVQQGPTVQDSAKTAEA
jgi:molecular chaperone GrpE